MYITNSSLGLICNERMNCYLWGKANIQMSSYITNGFGTIRRVIIHWLFFNSEKEKKSKAQRFGHLVLGTRTTDVRIFRLYSMTSHVSMTMFRIVCSPASISSKFFSLDRSFAAILSAWQKLLGQNFFFNYLFILILSTEGREPWHNFYGRVVFS